MLSFQTCRVGFPNVWSPRFIGIDGVDVKCVHNCYRLAVFDFFPSVSTHSTASSGELKRRASSRVAPTSLMIASTANLASPCRATTTAMRLRPDVAASGTQVSRIQSWVFVADHFELSSVVDCRGCISFLDCLQQSHRTGAKLGAVGEALPLRVNASALAVPAYGQPLLVRVTGFRPQLAETVAYQARSAFRVLGVLIAGLMSHSLASPAVAKYPTASLLAGTLAMMSSMFILDSALLGVTTAMCFKPRARARENQFRSSHS